MEFSCTAVNRPEIIERTFQSFHNNLKGVDFKDSTIIINVDPLPTPPTSRDMDKITSICKCYFGHHIMRWPGKPNFTDAVNFVWLMASDDVIFHLEDDWILKEVVDISVLMLSFHFNHELYQIVLRAYPYEYTKLVLSPSILHKRFYKAVAGKLDTKRNPETQLRGRHFGIEMPTPEHHISTSGKLVMSGDRVIVKDIGRDWLRKTNYRKPKIKDSYVEWIEHGK
jgi:hypothetical protein